MFRFFIGFILGIYVALYGVGAVVHKIGDIFNESKQIVNEQIQKDTTDNSN